MAFKALSFILSASLLTTSFTLGAQIAPLVTPSGTPQVPPLIPPPQIDLNLKRSKLFKVAPLRQQKSEKPTTGGGWGSSGGGSGIACFNSVKSAQQAGDLIKRNQTLTPELMKELTELVTLDYWEWKQNQSFEIITPRAEESPETFLDSIYERVARLAPLFIYRLQQASETIEINQWNSLAQVPRIYDAKPSLELPRNCQQIQLVARYAKETYPVGPGPAVRIPVVKIDVNQDLYSRLDNLNKAILILHEQMYLLGQLTGHKDSNGIRPLVISFLDKSLENLTPVDPKRYKLRVKLIYEFGDYIRYFSEDYVLQGTPFSQESRFNSYYELNRKLRERISLCERGGFTPEEMQPWNGPRPHTCRDYAMNPATFHTWMSDEIAFLYVANYLLDVSIPIFNSEYVFTPFAEGTSLNTMAIKTMKALCQFLDDNKNRFTLSDLVNKSLHYCEGFKNSLSPKGKDQN